MADRYTPEQVVSLLNNYLGTMADIITAYQGTIDEFIGDAILALFGAPVSRPDDAERAAACAVAMQKAMEAVNAHNRARRAARGADGHRGQHRRGGGREHRVPDPRQVRRGGHPRESRRPHRGLHRGRADPRLGVHAHQGGRDARGRRAGELRGQGLQGPGGGVRPAGRGRPPPALPARSRRARSSRCPAPSPSP